MFITDRSGGGREGGNLLRLILRWFNSLAKKMNIDALLLMRIPDVFFRLLGVYDSV